MEKDRPMELLVAIDNRLEKWDGKSLFKIRKTCDLSYADLETIHDYVMFYLQHGSFVGLERPVGKVEKVLISYGITC